MPPSRKQIKKPERVKTGIPGLDQLIQGGIPPASLTLVSGRAGTGKSIFGLQFLYYGAKEENEPGVYVSLEKDEGEIFEISSSFGWDLESLVKQKKISIIKPELAKFDTLKKIIEDEVDRIGAKRLVINPFSLITAYFENVYDGRKALADLIRQMKKLKCTAIVVSDIVEGSAAYSSTGYDEFVVNGLIVLDLVLKKDSNSFVRTMIVRKMERTEHSLALVPLEIDSSGISVYPNAEVF